MRSPLESSSTTSSNATSVVDTTEVSSTTEPDTTTSATLPPTTTTTTLPPLDPPTYESLKGIRTIRNWSSYSAQGLTRWQRSIEAIEDIRITSTADGTEQAALWLAPQGQDKPLIVALHSWSTPYLQHASIPFALFAEENGWAFIAPNFRGRYDDADAVGSDLAVQDVADAIDFAAAQDGVDGRRVLVVGFSGGGMMSLLVAGRLPDKVSAVAAYTAPYDLVDFYRVSGGSHYRNDLYRACGGDPRNVGDAQDECLARSPKTYLDAAREAGVAVFLGQGISDTLLPPSHSAMAFNQLADPEDRLTDEQVESMRRRRIPTELQEEIDAAAFFFADDDPRLVFARQSAEVWFVLFRGGHDMVYAPALRWFATDP